MKIMKKLYKIGVKIKSILTSKPALIIYAIIMCIISFLFYYWDTKFKNPNSEFILNVQGASLDFFKNAFSIGIAVGIIGKVLTDFINSSKRSREEEKRKIEQDQHLIIRKYIKTKNDDNENVFKNTDKSIKNNDIKDNYFDNNGLIMSINNTDNKSLTKSFSKKYVDDKEQLAKDIFKNNGTLHIANFNIFANIERNAKIIVDSDTGSYHNLDPFFDNNRIRLLGAHSGKTNNDTIRLDDLKYDKVSKSLLVNLSRTSYFDMLITNRAVDYTLDGITLRDLYEYRDNLSLLKDSKFSNQIGITGTIITKDGYILIEKRNLTKSTWRDKFGPTISYSLKTDKIFNKNDTIFKKDFDLGEKIIDTIEDSVYNNFNFIKDDDYDALTINKNFLGVARDALEGGKPNFYFYLQLKKDVEDVIKDMQHYASINAFDGKRKKIDDDKINSVYYFIKYDKFKVDYDYKLVCKRGTYIVDRKFSRKTNDSSEETSVVKKLNKTVIKEVAEGQLVCMSYLELLNIMKKNTNE